MVDKNFKSLPLTNPVITEFELYLKNLRLSPWLSGINGMLCTLDGVAVRGFRDFNIYIYII